MESITEEKTQFTRAFIMSTVLVIFALFFLYQNAYGAKIPKRSAPKSTPADVREEANKYFEQGEKLEFKGKYKEAAKKYRKAVKVDPTYAEAYSNLGYSYRKQKMYQEAIEAYKKAIKLKPDLAEAHEYLGEAYAEMGEFELAEKELQILRDLSSELAEDLEAAIVRLKGNRTDTIPSSHL